MPDKKEQILNAATRLFAKYGLKKTSVADIAGEAGVGKGTLYLFFESKEALFENVVRREAFHFLEKLKKAIGNEISASDKLRVFMITHFTLLDEVVNLHHMAGGIMMELWPEVRKALADFRKEEMSIIASILLEGEQNGEFEVNDIDLVSVALGAALEALDVPWVLDGREIGLDRKVKTLLDLIIRGLAGRNDDRFEKGR